MAGEVLEFATMATAGKGAGPGAGRVKWVYIVCLGKLLAKRPCSGECGGGFDHEEPASFSSAFVETDGPDDTAAYGAGHASGLFERERDRLAIAGHGEWGMINDYVVRLP